MLEKFKGECGLLDKSSSNKPTSPTMKVGGKVMSALWMRSNLESETQPSNVLPDYGHIVV